MSDTRTRLLDGTLEALRSKGMAGASARSIAAAAQVNQALIFYHFGSIGELLAAACRHHAQARVARYRDRFDRVRSLTELLQLGREIHAEEREAGNVAVLSQLLAGSQADPMLAAPTAAGLSLWTAELEKVLARVLADSPIIRLVDVRGLAILVSSSFIGLELVDGVSPDDADDAITALDRLGELVSQLDGPLARTALRRTVRKLG